MSSLSGTQLDRLQGSLRVPSLLGGRYRILGELGRGGMGVVYRARDTRLERDVAVKVIDPGVATEDLEARLANEARLIGRLGHPGIVPIYDLGRDDELTLFYVMKHVDGQTLERWLPAHASRSERLRLFQKLCDPVAFAHAQGIGHRDLKPANVMIGAFGEVLVMDWGLARPFEASATVDGSVASSADGGAPASRVRAASEGVASHAIPIAGVVGAASEYLTTHAGTPGYRDAASDANVVGGALRIGASISPTGAGASAAPVGTQAQTLVAADVFSLGAILFYLLTDQHPTVIGGALCPRDIDRTVDPRLNAICAHATHPSRSMRYRSVRELEEEVVRYLDGEAVHAYRETWLESLGRWVRRHQLVLSLILVYLLMRIVVALMR